jgi:transcriptional regulator with XRE-family HTH domain
VDKTPLAREFGTLVRRLRKAAGHSQEEFADCVGVHRTYMGAIERGEKTVTIATAARLAQALSMPLSQLFALLEEQRANTSSEKVPSPSSAAKTQRPTIRRPKHNGSDKTL